ncbi:hypothetical protein [Kitasatospora aureofaciens]
MHGPGLDRPAMHALDWMQLRKILRDNLDGELSIIVDAKGNVRLR